MPSPAEEAKGIVATWFKWADRGMFIGHCDKKALTKLEEAIAEKLVSQKSTYADMLALARDDIDMLQRKLAEAKPKAKAKPKGEAA